MIKIKDIPDAEANGLKWLMASGVKNDEEVLKISERFVGHTKQLREIRQWALEHAINLVVVVGT